MYVVLPLPTSVSVVFVSLEELSSKPSTVPFFAKPRIGTSTSATRKSFCFVENFFEPHLCRSRLLANLTSTPGCSSGAQIVHTAWYVF